MKNKKRGFAPVFIIVAVLTVLIAGGEGVYYLKLKNKTDTAPEDTKNLPVNNTQDDNKAKETEQKKTEVKNEPKWSTQEEVLYTIPKGQNLWIDANDGYYREPVIYFSDDGKQFSYQVFMKETKKWISSVNGKEGGWRSDMGDAFKNTANYGNYIKVTPTKNGDIFSFVYNGKNFGEVGKVPSSCVVSKDNTQNAYVVTSTETWKRNVIMNGKKGPEYTVIGLQSCAPVHSASCTAPFAFSYDGKQNAYIAQKSKTSYTVVLNGEEGRAYTEIYYPTFSFDSKHFAYSALDRSAFVVIDGEAQKKYDGVYNVRFNKEGALIYNAVLGDKIILVTQRSKESATTASQEPSITTSGQTSNQVSVPVGGESAIDNKNTEEWNTYKSTQLGFEIKYPQDWKFEEPRIGAVNFYPSNTEKLFASDKNYPWRIYFFTGSADQYLKSQMDRKKYNINGIEVVEFIPTSKDSMLNAIIYLNDKTYIVYVDGFSAERGCREVFSKMLPTLKKI